MTCNYDTNRNEAKLNWSFKSKIAFICKYTNAGGSYSQTGTLSSLMSINNVRSSRYVPTSTRYYRATLRPIRFDTHWPMFMILGFSIICLCVCLCAGCKETRWNIMSRVRRVDEEKIKEEYEKGSTIDMVKTLYMCHRSNRDDFDSVKSILIYYLMESF